MFKIKLLIFLSVFFMLSTTPARAIISDWQRGVSISPSSSESFSSQNLKTSLDNLASTYSNYVTFIIPYYQSDIYSTNLARGSNTPSDSSLISAIRYAHSKNLLVNLKIHPEAYSGEWRANINPSDRQAWFSAYGNILNHYAQLASQNGVEQLTLGAEIYKMTSPKIDSTNTQHWQNLISAVRQRFSGKVTYSAQHTNPYEANEIEFWDKLDYIGIAAYFPLATDKQDPLVEELRASWDRWNRDLISPLANIWGKQVIFTEIGYRSLDGAHKEPWSWWASGSPDMEEQSRDYEALFSYWNNKPFMRGVHWWQWSENPNAGGHDSTDYTPQNKPAQDTMKNWYQSSVDANPDQPPAKVTISTSASLVSGQSKVGEPVRISAVVKPDNSINNLIVDLEVYDQNNQKVKQIYYDNQSFNANQAQTYYLDWTPSVAQNYVFKVGLFAANWSSLHHWNDNALTFEVSLASQPSTPTPTSNLPPSTSTPTPTTPADPPTATPSPSLPSPTPTPTNTVTTPTPSPQPQSYQLEIWWPVNDVHLSGIQPFKALVPGLNLNDYYLFWQVDGGQYNFMSDSQQDYPHKESHVDISSWNWNNNGPYTINFIAQDLTGRQIVSKSIQIFISR